MNQVLEQIVNYQIYTNTVGEYLLTLLMIVLVVTALHLIKIYGVKHLKRIAKRTKTDLDDRLAKLLKKISFSSYLIVATYISLGTYLDVSANVYKVLEILLIIVLTHEFLTLLTAFIDLLVDKYTTRSKRDFQNKTLKQGIKLMAAIVVWIIAIILILSNLGLEISALVASLGIGGIAVALAAQGILGDLLSSFLIYFDRPFEVGDFIIVGQDMGTVKKIGFRSSRIQALNGEEIVISNQDLSKARLQNFRKMKKRRVVIRIGVTYGTSSKKLKKAKQILTKAIQKQEGIELERVHFAEFGEWALFFEAVFYMLNSDYTPYMDTREKINLEIIDQFEKNGIQFAIPAQRLFMEQL